VLLAAAAAGCRDRGSERALARFGGGPDRPVASHAGEPEAPGLSASRAGHGDRLPPRPPHRPQTPDGLAGVPAPAIPEAASRPDRFLGLSPARLTRTLGPPSLVRREGPAQVWQYRAERCVVDLVLYPGESGPAVRHLEARGRPSGAAADPQACLTRLLQRADRPTPAAPTG
jgi:hypothetical protein